MNAVEICLAAMRETVARLDELLVPWGFAFDLAENGDASPGAFASGFYRRGPTRLGLVYRRTLGLGVVLYERETVTQNGCLREHEVFGMDHLAYMRELGHGDDCKLVVDGICSLARNGGDPVAALLDDLREYAASTLQKDCPEFAEIMRTGYRRYSVE
ncbi:MAG: hypothetical protein ACLQLG_12980 [Thermoguttaceae bacterium]